ncbi:YDG domain-containing protein [Achromobacter marplatensis]|uniref:YDG domain-containing protein n=1 Tax=Achromobacter marplatensis TaxID=470868 RepID=A0AA42WBB2_9BURK|nr:YDG domain-containing protein [Achromobacter marplatensis]MDH2050802.1 YDG domain-containing protein [Achromobacter marplatensis]
MKKPSLNHIFRLVWNEALGVYVPVAEYASARRKRSSGSAAALTAALLLSGPALAADLPTGGNVVAGAGSISQNGSAMTINQQTGKMAVDWQSFSIGKGNSVTFNQPGRDSVALNRVLGPDVSVIQGALNANGQVFLVNPNGVVFTPTAQVNVGGIVASTLNISTQDFLAGNYKFEGASSNAIINQGNITAAPGGSIALIAAKITNTGNLTADKGNVLLGAGSRVKLDLGGPVKIEVEQGAIDALIEQGGAIRADGGVVYLTAKAAGDLASTVINHTGITQAKTLATGENGKIVLLGDMVNDRIAVAGKLDASAPNGGKGGFVETSAAKVTVAAGAVITTKAVSGQHGSWLIDPTDFTVSAGTTGQTDSGIGADTLSANLDNGNVELRTVDNGSQAGNINVNSGVKWSASTKLTLSAHGDVNINAPITATGAEAGLELNLGGFKQRGYSSGGSYSANAPVTLSGAQSTFKVNGQGYTLLRSVQDIRSLDQLGFGYYALAQDLDLKGSTFSTALVSNLQGTLAGLGHTIDNLNISTTNGGNLGLIGTITNGSEVRDLAVTNATIVGTGYLGTLAGTNEGTIRNVAVSGSVTGETTLGGLVAANNSVITGSNARTTVTSTSKGYFLGGLVGNNGVGATIDNAYSTGNVSGGNTDTGGLVGANSGTIRNAYATGNVIAAADGLGLAIGGLVGSARENSVISNVFASGRVEGANRTGGIVGMFSGTGIVLENARWDAATTGQANATGLDAGGTVTGTAAVGNAFSYTSYANLGTWSQVPNSNNVWVAKDAAGKAQWIMIEGQTRPFLASEYSLAVSNDHQLQLMSYDLNASYNIVRDIDAKATGTVGSGMWGTGGFSPIGSGVQFAGSLDGQGHVISNLTVGTNMPFSGLFGIIGQTGTVRSVGLENAVVGGFIQAGALAAVNYGTIDNVYANAKVSTQGLGNGVGGLVGQNFGTISNAYSSGTVSTNGPLIGQVGGLVGYNVGTINKSYSTTKIDTIFPYPGNGALVGYNGGFVNDSFAASTDAAGNPASVMPLQLVGSNGGTVNAASGMKTYAELSQLSTFKDAGWDIDNAGGTGAMWRIYEGAGGPLLRGFLKQVTVSLADKVYDGQISGGVGYIASRPGAELGGSISYTSNSKNAGTYSVADGSLTVNGGLYSNQQGYDIIYADGLSLNVLKKGVTVDVTADNKTYDGTTNAVVRGQAGIDMIAGDNLGAIGVGNFSDKNAGAGKTVTVGGITLTGADAGNYFITSVTSPTTTATINAKTLTGQVTAGNKVYDGLTNASFSATIEGMVGTDLVYLSANFADKNVGQAKLVTLGLLGADAGNYVLGSGLATSTANITPKTLTGVVTISDKVYDGTTKSDAGAYMTGGLIQGDDVQIYGAGTFSDKNVGQGKTVSTRGTLLGADANNYAVSVNSTATASITPKALTGSITAAGKTYDGTRDADTSGQLTGAVQGDTVTLASTGLFADKNAGVGKTVAVTGLLQGADAGNYTVSYNGTTTATISPKALTGAITAAGKTYDGTLTADTNGTLTGKVAGDTVSLSSTGAFADKNAGAGKQVNVNGMLAGADAGNYTVTFNTTTTADIAARQLTGALGALDKVYDGSSLASVTGVNSLNLLSGDLLTVSGSFSDKNVANGKSVAYVLGGADANNYTLGNGVTKGKANITPATLAGDITAAGKVYDGSVAATTQGRVTGVILGDVVGLSTTGAFADKNVGNGKTVNVGGSLTGLDAGNYILAANATTTANITPKAITGALTAAGKVYDGSRDAATTGTLNGVVQGDNVAVNATGLFGDKNVGNGKLVAVNGVLTGADAGNYQLSTNATTLANITPKALTGAITAAGKTYDGTTAADTSGSLNGVVQGDTVALSTTGAFADKNAGVGKQVNVNGRLTGVDAGNYTVSANGTTAATITPKSITGAITAAGKVYDGSVAASTSGSLTGQILADAVALSTTGSFADKNVGNGKTVNVGGSLTGADAGNYTLVANTTTTANITPKAITGALTAAGKVYDGSRDAATTGTLNGVVQGDNVAVNATGLFGDKNVGNGKLVAVNGVLTGADAGNYLLSTNATTQANITPKALTGAITAAGKTYDGTTAADTSGSLNGVVQGDTVALTTTGAFADKNAAIGKLVNVRGSLTGADAGNYTVSANGTTTATIAARQLNGALGALDKVYDGNTVATVTGADAIAGIIAGDSLGVAGSFSDKNAGEGKTVAFGLTGGDAGNYELNAADARAAIARRVLGVEGTTVAGKVYDGSTAAQASAGSLTNLVEGESLGVGTTATFDSANAGNRNANVRYALADGDNGLASNYVLADTQHQAVIDRRAITVAADDKTKRAGDVDPALTWRVTQGNLVGSDTLAGVLNRAAGETAGNYVIGAGGLSNSNYLVAAQDGTLVISNAVQPDTRRDAALSTAQWLQAAVGTANTTPPTLSGELSFVPVESGNQGQGGTAKPAPNAGQGARSMQGPAQVLVIDGGIRLPEGVVQGGI